VPEGLEELYHAIVERQRQGRFQEAAARYPDFLAELAKRWGDGARDLVPYHYNYALALRLARLEDEALREAELGLRTWPDSLQHRVLSITLRSSKAIAGQVYSDELHRAYSELLQDKRLAALRAHRVEPVDLFTQWGQMLLRSGRASEAAAVAARGLRLAPEHPACLEILGQGQLGSGKAGDAVTTLRKVAARKDSPGTRYLIALALFDSGQAAEAAPLFEELLAKRPPGFEPGKSWGSPGNQLRLRAAQAFNALGRHAEALECLLVPSCRDPEDPDVTRQAELAARGLGRAAAADALVARRRELAICEDFLRNSRQARRAGDAASEAYYVARHHLAASQTGLAIEALERGLRVDSAPGEIHGELARVRRLLGRDDLAERGLQEARARRGSALIDVELAIVLAARGQSAEGRRLLEPWALGEPGSTKVSAGALPHALIRAARFEMEAGEPARARSLLEAKQLLEDRSDAYLLLRAELAVRGGEFEKAAPLLAESFEFLPGGAPRARVLRAIAAGAPGAGRGGAAIEDASDLIDNADLLDLVSAEAAAKMALGASGKGIDGVRELRRRRDEVIARMSGIPDRDCLSRWRELLALYRDAGARRKARELAWYLDWLEPRSAGASLELARVLDRPEESLQRLSAASRGLESRPGDAELQAIAAAARDFLGLGAAPASGGAR
jgi:predicted Zn-dependent protease